MHWSGASPRGTSTSQEGFGKVQIPLWTINKVQIKVLNSNWEDSSNNNLQPTSNNTSMEQQIQTGNNNNQVQANINPGISKDTQQLQDQNTL